MNEQQIRHQAGMPAVAVGEWVDGNQPMTEARDDFIEFENAVAELGPGILAKLMNRGGD